MILWVIGGVAIGGLAGLMLGAGSSAEDESDEDNAATRAENSMRQRVERKWRYRIRRRRQELRRRSGQAEKLRARITGLKLSDEDHEAHEVRRAALAQQRSQTQSLNDRKNLVTERCEAARTGLVDALVGAAQTDAETLTAGLTAQVLEDAEARSAQRERQLRQRLEIDGEDRARALITEVVQRYSESHSVDRLRSSLRVDNEEHRAELLAVAPYFEAEFGMNLEAGERDGLISIRGADPLMRELSHRILSKLPQGKAEPALMARLRSSTEEAMRRQSAACSQEAIEELGVGAVDGERRRLLDRLRYRHSYRQNQWRHAAEVGFLSGMLAAELDLNVPVARRGGLLHDIGKAMTHETDGGHAPLGAAVARQEDEDERVSSCIGAHHGDEPPIGLEPFLVAAGDAISGARPGARVQGGEHHEAMIRALEQIGRSNRAVENAYTVRGGRELRVELAMEDRAGRRLKISPQDMKKIAADMKRRIEEEMTFPGTIDVTIIRRVVAEAIVT
jgi:ribonuclease Y